MLMPGDISRSYKGPKDGSLPSWMDEPSEPSLPRLRKKADVEGWTTEELLIPNLGWSDQKFPPLNEQAAEHPPFDNPHDPFAAPDRMPPGSNRDHCNE